MLKRVQKAAFKIDGLQLDRNLSRNLTPPELAGAYILRSIDVQIKARCSFDEIVERHGEMTRVAMQIRSEQFEEAQQ